MNGLMFAAIMASRRQAAADPNVRLLLHFDGGFTDSSAYARPVTVGGNPSPSDPVSRFGTAGSFDGSGDVLTFAASSTLDIPGTGDWTWEASVRFRTIGTRVLYQHAVGTGLYPLQVLMNSSGYLQVRGLAATTAQAYDISSSFVASADTWYVLGVKRSGSTISFWVNGVQQGVATFAGVLFGSDLPVAIGAYPNGSFSLDGQMDELRLTIGVARDLSAVPSSPF